MRHVNDAEKFVGGIKQICLLKDKTTSVIEKCFGSSQAITAAQKSAFEVFLNVEGRQDRSAQLLALMIDHDMKNTNLQEWSSAVCLYRMLHATDTFD